MNAIKAFVDLSKYLGSLSMLDEMLEAKESVVSKQDPAPAPVGCALASIPKRPPTADSSPPSPPPSPPPPPQQQEPAQEEQQQKRPTRTVAMAETVPPEIFMKICEFLPPLDLLSLEGVCRRFCEFLRTRDSPKTQDIWRKARLRFMPTLPMPPPNGMDEYAYVRLGVVELGCQFCSRTVVPKICWEFRVRCCRKCLIKRTVSDVPEVAEKLVSGMPAFVSCLPFVTVDHQQKRYWGEQVRKAMEEYDALPETPDTPPGDSVPATWDADTPVWGEAEHKTPSRDASGECGSGSRSENGNGDENEHYVGRPTAKKEWRLQQFVKTKEILQDSIARAAAEKQGRKVWRKQNKLLLQNLLARLVSESKSANEAGKRVVLKAEDLKKCPSYLKASCSLDSPLSETTLEALKQKIADEYEYVSREDLIRKRQNDLFQTIVRIRNAVKEAWRAGRASNKAGSSERKQRASSSRTLKDAQRSLAAIGMRVLGNVAGERVHSVAKQPNLNFIQPLDSALKHIRMCKSYNNPKFPDDNPQQPWDEDFLYDSLIPAICREAEGIEEVERGQQSCFGVRKALVQGWGDQQVFKCSLCRNRKHYTYQGIQQHLRSTLHRVRRVIEDDMIEVQLMHGVMMEEDSVWLAHLPLPAVYDETDAVVKVYMSGVCETDLKNEWCTTDSNSTREQRTIPGHQFVGVIHDLGKSVPGFAVGDRVISTPKTRCGECTSCTSPASSFCLRAQVYGWTWDGKRLDGGQAEYVRVPFASDALIKIPDEVSDKEAILLSEPLTCGYHCAKTGLAQFAESERHALKVVVLGCGPVGLSAVAAVQHLGCQSANVYAVDVNAERLDLAHQFGATKIKFSRESWLQHDQLNADLLLYTSDAIELTSLTVALRPGAVICIGMSNCSRRTEVRVPTDIDVFITSKLCSIKETIPEAIDLVLARKWNLESIVGTVVQLRDSEDVYKTQRSNLESYVMVGLLVNRNTH